MVSFCRTALIDSKINDLMGLKSCGLKDDLAKYLNREVPLELLKEVAKESNMPLHELLQDAKVYMPPPIESNSVCVLLCFLSCNG
jgi:hypothetical protein